MFSMRKTADHLFAPVPAAELAFFRFLFCAYLAAALFLEYYGNSLLVLPEQALRFGLPYHPIPLLRFLGNYVPALQELKFAFWGLLACLIAAGIGALPRIFLALAFLLGLFVFGSVAGFSPKAYLGEMDRTLTLPLAVIFFLACSPATRGAWRGTTIRAWPLFLLRALVAAAFFSAGLAKLRYGTAWLEGQTLQAYLLERNLFAPNAWAMELARHVTACRIISFTVLAFELSFPLAVLSLRIGMFYALAAVVFHLLAAFFLGVTGFIAYFIPAYFVFVPWGILWSIFRRR